MMLEQSDHLNMTADIVGAFVGHNTVRAAEVPDLIATVHAALAALINPQPVEAPKVELTPAVSVKKSITDGYLICLDDGKKFKSLRRHLTILGMTPEDYRAKWGLPRDYPMVAPGYAAIRSALAKEAGLGSRNMPRSAKVVEGPTPADVAEPTPADSEAEPVKRRGRPKKAA